MTLPFVLLVIIVNPFFEEALEVGYFVGVPTDTVDVANRPGECILSCRAPCVSRR